MIFVNNSNERMQIPKELEERLKQIRDIIREDTAEYARVPSIRDLANELAVSMEEVAECVLYLPTDEFCDFISFLSQYEWEMVSQISEMKQAPEADSAMEEDDDTDYTLLENFHFMT